MTLTVTDFGVALVSLGAEVSAPMPELLEFKRLDSAEGSMADGIDPRPSSPSAKSKPSAGPCFPGPAESAPQNP
jgi:hypothetical protein